MQRSIVCRGAHVSLGSHGKRVAHTQRGPSGARRRKEVQGGTRRRKEVQGGARRCKEVQGGARRCKEVQGGARRCDQRCNLGPDRTWLAPVGFGTDMPIRKGITTQE